MGHTMMSVIGLFALSACTAATTESPTQTTRQGVVTASEGSGASPAGSAHPHPHGPPPEAFTACESKAVGDACQVAFGGNAVEGHCASPPPGGSDTRAACRPDNLPDHAGGHGGHRGPPGPPPEGVFTACAGKASDDACTVTLGDHTFSGTCQAPPPGVQESRLGCMPPRPAR